MEPYRAPVAVPKVFNPPPNWPAAPPGWRPPPGWAPDPAWGPAPVGWLVFERVNPHPFLRSIGISTLVYVVVTSVMALTVGITSYQVGGLFPQIALIPGLATGLLLRSRPAPWPPWKIALSILAVASLFALFTLLSAVSEIRP